MSRSPLYTPADFAADPGIGWQIVREQPFGLLLLPEGGIAPLPLLCDESSHELRGHLARANPASSVPDGSDVTVLFLGPHAYVSPTWYASPREQVPTWNYVFVRMSGTLTWLASADTRLVLDDLCARFEEPGGYSPAAVDPAQMDAMLHAISGFRIRVHDVQAKLKLSQNRSPEDRERVRRHFERGPAPGPGLAAWMARTTR
ncbi:MAG TPA: FMN-binding negative transcriptional regulator [Vulgatibacter sp.]